MPRISDIEMLEKAEQPSVAIRTTTSADKLHALIGESYGKLAAYLNSQGRLMADVPYVAYHTMDMQNLDVEMGFPLASPLPGDGDIQPSQIPAGKYVFCMFQGSYADVEPVYADMATWINDHKLAPAGPAYEAYYNGPDIAPDLELTMILMPVR
ncbi:MAG: GyrI-like domain-containing protein [Propionibacteriaceae bacterium]|jgi:effector-binding domain-containing protein|nr:GyrI-like domain-containing protein [Propionibacteriaceae bacterium]